MLKEMIKVSFVMIMIGALFVMNAVAQSTEFTYQGRLLDGSFSANGLYDLTFQLYDIDDLPMGVAISREDVQVTNGLFTVSLDFGSTAFSDGRASTIEIGVRPGASTLEHTRLSPRQPITSSPYTIKSRRANTAGLADNSTLFGGQSPASFATAAQVSLLQAQVNAQQNAITSQQALIEQLQSDLAASLAGTNLWSRRFGDSTSQIAYSIAIDPAGNIIVAGTFQGIFVDFGGTLLTTAGVDDVFVAKYSGSNGSLQWARRFGGTNDDLCRSIALDAAGNVYITGYFVGTANFGGANLTSAGGRDVFLAKLSGTDGTHIWSRRSGGTDQDVAVDLAVDNTGNPIITGSFRASAEFGGSPLTAGGLTDVFVAKYTAASGAHIWSKGFGGVNFEAGAGIIADDVGDIYFTGDFGSPTISFGGATLTNAGDDDAYLVKLSSASGSHIWSRRFGGSGRDEGTAIAIDGSGNLFVAGFFDGASIDLGGGPLTNIGGIDTFIAKYDPNGNHSWSKALGGPSSDLPVSINVDSQGDVALTGIFSEIANFGGASLNSAGSSDIFLAKYAGSNGQHRWSRRFGGAERDAPSDLVFANNGDIFLTGLFESPSLDFGGGPIGSAGNEDIFIAKLRR